MGKKTARKIQRATQVFIRHEYVDYVNRLGFFVRGVIYIILGWFGIELSLGLRNSGANFLDVIVSVSSKPFGKVFLLIIIVGLGAYSLWGVARGVFNVLDEDNKPVGWLIRLGYLLSAASYGSLTVATILILKGQHLNSSANDPVGVSVKLWNLPYGQILLLIFGIAWIAAFFGQIISLNQTKLKIARIGQAARATLFAFIGVFIVKASFIKDPYKVYGIGQTLEVLKKYIFGPEIVAAISLGIIFYGIFSIFVSAKFNSVYGKKLQA